MRAVGGLGQASDVLAHGVARDPEPPGDLPQGEALDPTKVLTRGRTARPRLISSSGRIRPSPFSRIVAVVRASSRESATCPLGEPRAHPAPSPICSRKGYAQSFRHPSGRFAAAIAKTSGWGRPRTAGGPQARPRRQSEAPIRYLPVPHSAHTARSAGRPFFMVTRSTSRDGVFARHFRQ